MTLRTLLVCLLVVSASLWADQIILINGDRISGRIQRLEDGKLLIRTDLAGALTLPWENVGAVVSTQPLYAVLKDGRVFTGTIVNAEGGMRLQDSTQSMVVTRDSIVTLRSFNEQLQYQRAEERRVAPHFLDPWSGTLDTGVSLARGNANVTTYTLNGAGVRERPSNKLSLYFNSLYTRNRALVDEPVTANVRRGGGRFELNVSKRQFAFVSADLEFDELQRLDLRTVAGLGYGIHVVQTRRNTLDFFAGATWNREVFATGLRRTSAEALFSEESSHRLNDTFSIKQRLAVFPNLSDTGAYRLLGDATAATTLLRWLSWQVSVSNRYLNNPVPGSRRNDLLLTTGFRFTLLPYKGL